MIVENKDIAEGRLAILPVGWQQHGNVKQALAHYRKQWREDNLRQWHNGQAPSGWGLVMAADSDRAVVIEVVPNGWGSGGTVMLKVVPGSQTGETETREVPREFDVVDIATGEVAAEARFSKVEG
ncbi:MAG: hypothetical protein E6Q97_36285 [Desulfurellales bacterium]|nr:MAG: hypothetical protein E6Q97_36285 [Desulfurellales bacterium]